MFNPIPTGQNRPIYEYHVTTAGGRNRVKASFKQFRSAPSRLLGNTQVFDVVMLFKFLALIIKSKFALLDLIFIIFRTMHNLEI